MREWKLDYIGKGNAERIKCFSDYDWKLEIMVIALIIASVAMFLFKVDLLLRHEVMLEHGNTPEVDRPRLQREFCECNQFGEELN